jgi:hypothetical protein
MPFTIHASKDGRRAETQRIRPVVAVAKARSLTVAGWDVYVTDLAGRQYSFDELDHLTNEAGSTARALPLS